VYFRPTALNAPSVYDEAQRTGGTCDIPAGILGPRAFLRTHEEPFKTDDTARTRATFRPTTSGGKTLNDLAGLFAGARDVALRAGGEILRIEREGCGQVWRKADDSVLTRADLAANALICEDLAQLDPDAVVISEEGVTTIEGVPHRFWLVDPLDGTREFLAGNGEYTVNIALVEDGVPIFGVVHAPARAITYLAVRGGGAWRSGADGTCAIRASASGTLVVVASRSHPGRSLEAFLNALPPHETVAMGSSLKICAVADGSAQLYPRLGPTSWWDTAAAHAVALEAGATLETLAGAALRYDGPTVRNPPFVCASVPRTLWAPAADQITSEQA
jgi:3'(2'), 5'-bisphosphate nucleotidase